MTTKHTDRIINSFKGKVRLTVAVYIFSAILFVVLLGVGLRDMYQNHQAGQTALRENYIKAEAEITFAGKTGTAHRAKTLLHVAYHYGGQNYKGAITRPYQKEGYYQKGDKIIININPNNPQDVK